MFHDPISQLSWLEWLKSFISNGAEDEHHHKVPQGEQKIDDCMDSHEENGTKKIDVQFYANLQAEIDEMFRGKNVVEDARRSSWRPIYMNYTQKKRRRKAEIS